MSAVELSIVIVSWNSWDVLRGCIQSIYDTVDAAFEIILVDNNSADNTVNLAREAFHEVRILLQDRNLGFSKGANLGFLRSTGEYVLFLNPDVILKKGAVNDMLIFLRSHSDIGIVGPKIMKADGMPDFEYTRKLPRLHSDIFKIFLISRVIVFLKNKLCLFGRFRKIMESRDIESGECEFIEGSSMLLRRRTFEALEGFDENAEMYLDDIDLSYRVRKMGLKNYYLASSEIVHLKQYSTKKTVNPKAYGIAGMKARVFYYRKHFGGVKAALYKTVVILSIPYLLALDIVTLPHYLLVKKGTESLLLFKKHLQYIDIIGA